MYATEFLPESRGFASFLGFLDGGEDYYYHDNLGGQHGLKMAASPPACPSPRAGCTRCRALPAQLTIARSLVASRPRLPLPAAPPVLWTNSAVPGPSGMDHRAAAYWPLRLPPQPHAPE